MLDAANFLAGRLHALEPRNPDSSHLLALTYLRLRRFKAAYDFSQKFGASGRHLGCAYTFAQACLELGRHTEGCAALEKAKGVLGRQDELEEALGDFSEACAGCAGGVHAHGEALAGSWRSQESC